MTERKLSDKEAAFLEAAKRELKGGTAAAAPTASSVRPPSGPVAAPDSPKPPQDKAALMAERMAQLMAEEAEQNRRQFKRQRLWFVYLPVGLLILAVLKILFGGRRKT
jgi:hypothetical protein